MKTLNKILFTACTWGVAQILLTGCMAEDPFTTDGEGEVMMNITINSRLTRAVSSEEMDHLRENCVIYISNSKGLLHKWQGVDNVPEKIALRYGSYLAEAWSGDSVTASIDKKFYKGASQFEVSENQGGATQVSVTCRLANVVASVDENTIDRSLIDEVNVEFANSRGEYTLTNDSLMNKVYFMMPDNDNSLTYTVNVRGVDGKEIKKTGVIEDVVPAHEYRISFASVTPDEIGGIAFIEIQIQEFDDVYEDDVIIYSAPVFSWQDGMDLGSQITRGANGQFETATLKAAAYGSFTSLLITPNDDKSKSAIGDYSGIELIDMTEVQKDRLEQLGIEVRYSTTQDGISKAFISFTDKWLNSLPVDDSEYSFTVTAKDDRYVTTGKSNSVSVKIATSDNAIVASAPFTVDEDFFTQDRMAVKAHSATLPVNIVGELDNAMILYRKVGSGNWLSVPVSATRASSTHVSLTNLEPGSKYDYKCVNGSLGSDGRYEFESSIAQFTTEGIYQFPNSSMENWYQSGSVWIPMSSASESFWDSGNHGSATLKVNLTNKDTNYHNTGSASAKLASQFVGVANVLGKFAAGNLFAGSYDKTDGTNAELTFGRAYNGTHPKSLKVYANYRPGKVNYLEGEATKYLTKGENDHGQIYVAIASSPFSIKTKTGQLFNKDADNILGYGEVTWKDNVGEDGKLSPIEINIDYYDKAKNTEAKYIIVVCSASKYGDFFSGGNSVLYLDDFELIYE